MSTRVKAVAVLAAAATGFSGAAVVDALASGRPHVTVAADFGAPGDGLTRVVARASGGEVTDAQLVQLRAVPGVVQAQRLFDGSALVATDGLGPGELTAVVPDLEMTMSAGGTVAGATITDPAWATYGWNLQNNGENAYGQPTSAGIDVAAPDGWQATAGRGVVVAVVDSGLQVDHPDLQGALWTNPDEPCGSADSDGNGYAGDCHGWNFYRQSADVTNGGPANNSHGTTVAGVVAARAGNGVGSAGVAPDVTVMPLVVGSGMSVDISAASQAIVYAADNGASVVNASWISNSGPEIPILTAAIEYARSKNVLVVAAAGNDAGDRDTHLLYPASQSADNLIKVGASTAADRVADFSAYGARTVDLYAPGLFVYTTTNDGGYDWISGTSIAAPHVAAAAALYRARHPGATALELRQQLLADTVPVAAYSGRSVTGGRLSLAGLGRTADDVRFTFSGMESVPGTVEPSVVVDGDTAEGESSVTLGLGMEFRGEVMALADHPITLDGVVVSTDEGGQATFPLGRRANVGPLVLAPRTDLAQGRYVLLVQMSADGQPVGRAQAAPLLVGVPAAAGPDDGGSTPPDDGTAPVPGTTDPLPGTTPPSEGSDPASPTPGTSGPDGGTTPPADGSEPVPGASDPLPGATPPDPGTDPVPGTTDPLPGTTPPAGGSDPVPDPASPTPGTSGPDGGTAPPADGVDPDGGTTPPAGGTDPEPDPTSPSPGSEDLLAPGGTKVYPPTGPFGLTSITPTRVSALGGTEVTITGTAIPADPIVRVGDSAVATIVRSSGTEVVFTTPARSAGTYDVHVIAQDRVTTSVLDDGLVYLAVDGSGSPGDPDGSTDPSTDPDGSTDPSTDPGGSTDPSTDPDGTEPPSGTDPVAVPREFTGPNGERLVRSELFASLGRSIWLVNCTTTCGGLAV